MKIVGVNEAGGLIEADSFKKFAELGGMPQDTDTIDACTDPIWGVNVAFNVQAKTSDEAWNKLSLYLGKHFQGFYESLEQPVLQPHITADDCETLIT